MGNSSDSLQSVSRPFSYKQGTKLPGDQSDTTTFAAKSWLKNAQRLCERALNIPAELQAQAFTSQLPNQWFGSSSQKLGDLQEK